MAVTSGPEPPPCPPAIPCPLALVLAASACWGTSVYNCRTGGLMDIRSFTWNWTRPRMERIGIYKTPRSIATCGLRLWDVMASRGVLHVASLRISARSAALTKWMPLAGCELSCWRILTQRCTPETQLPEGSLQDEGLGSKMCGGMSSYSQHPSMATRPRTGLAIAAVHDIQKQR
jgi:hypothetical protein